MSEQHLTRPEKEFLNIMAWSFRPDAFSYIAISDRDLSQLSVHIFASVLINKYVAVGFFTKPLH